MQTQKMSESEDKIAHAQAIIGLMAVRARNDENLLRGYSAAELDAMSDKEVLHTQARFDESYGNSWRHSQMIIEPRFPQA